MPFVAVVAPSRGYAMTVGGDVAGSDIDITARMVSTGRPHHAYATTGAMCLAAATRLLGTIPNEVARGTGEAVRIGHPKGVIRIGVDADAANGPIRSVSIDRTARLLISGTAFARDPGRL